jgi:hypothetical protein
MKRIVYLSLIVLALLVVTACDKKQHAIDKLSDFVEKVEKNSPEFTEEGWNKADKEFEDLVAETEKYEYSSQEVKRIAELKGRYAGIKAKNSVNKLIEGIDKAANEIKGTIEGFTDGIIGNSKEQEE